MELGLALPQYDYSVPGEPYLRWDVVVEWATRAEAAGFDSLWLADHLFLTRERYGGPPEPRYDGLDPLVALAALARLTSRVRLGTLVLCAQLRPPAVLAKALASIDRLAGGRLVVGLGAGWNKAEYVEAGVPFLPLTERLDQLGEVVEILRRLFASEEPVTWVGRHYRVAGARCRPGPVRRPPVWIGGKSDLVLDTVARHGAEGWNTVWRWTPAAYRRRLDVLAAACERHGRDPASVELSIGLTTVIGEDEADLRRRRPGYPDLDGALTGTVDQVRDQLAAWEQLGVTTVIVGLGALPFSVTTPDDLELVAAARP